LHRNGGGRSAIFHRRRRHKRNTRISGQDRASPAGDGVWPRHRQGRSCLGVWSIRSRAIACLSCLSAPVWEVWWGATSHAAGWSRRLLELVNLSW